jgi:hypothetical protein
MAKIRLVTRHRRRRKTMKLKPIVSLGLLAQAVSVPASAQSDAQESFDKLKTPAGSWERHMTTVRQAPDIDGKVIKATLRSGRAFDSSDPGTKYTT